MFDKIVAITDLHFGRSSGNMVANQDNLDFLEWAIERARTWGAKKVAVLGDWHDSRHSVTLGTIHMSLKAMEMLNDAFDEVHFITGNHDLMYRDKRDVASTVFAKNLQNFRWINQPTTYGKGRDGVTFLPWLVGDERKLVRNIDSRYIFAHAEINGGFLMNEKVPMPDHDGGLEIGDFDGNEYLFSGHYHFRQAKSNVVYIGNIMPFNFADDWDEDRGMMLLEWGKEPTFEAWPDQPLFRTMKLSDLMGSPNKFIKPKMTVRATLDMTISYEESLSLRDEFVKTHQLRKLETIKLNTKAEITTDMKEEVQFQTVKQIVNEGLDQFDSKEIETSLLKQIFTEVVEMAGK